MIVDFRKYKEIGIEVTDIKEKINGLWFSPPTVSFPVSWYNDDGLYRK